ncbi:MAG: porin family protein [Muribaculaceae bacterium]|nr:porin family protein [Muribaculaceae bacterium]
MKKSFTRIALAVAALMLTAGAAEVSAETGEKTLGIAAGFSSYNNGGYADIYFHYTLAPHVRIAPEIGYGFRNEGKSLFEFSVDAQFPFRVARGFNLYPLAGITYNNWSYHEHGHASRAGLDLGGGAEAYLTSNLKLNLQIKYSMMNDTSGAFINLGIGYVF